MRSLLSMTKAHKQQRTPSTAGGKKKIKLRLAHPCSQQYYSQQPNWSTCVEATKAYISGETHAIEYCSALKRNEVLICATSLMNFEITTLSEINQTQKDKCCMTPPPWGTENRQHHRDREQSSSPGAWRRGEMRGDCLLGISFLFGMVEKFWKWIVVMVTQHEWI